MRLTSDEIKQGILHPAQEVRDACIFYFADSFSDDATIMPLAIQAIKRHGWRDAFGAYSFLESLVQTEDTFTWAIAQLRQRGQPDGEEEASLTRWLLDVLTNATPDLLRAHQAEIRELDALDEYVREAIEEKLLLDGFTAKKLWSELEGFCEHNYAEDYLPDEEIDFAHALVEVMGRHPTIFDTKVLEILSQDIEDYADKPMLWLMVPCLVRLAGELRLRQAIPLIVEKLHDDDEMLNPDCVRSLVKIGTDEVVDALADDFPEADWGFRVTGAEVFEHIHTDRSVQRCLALLDSEEDLEIKCQLAQSVLMNFSDEAIEPARQLVLTSDLDPDMIEVRSCLLAVTMLMGIQLPEQERWREESKHDVEFRKMWYAEHYMGGADEEYLEDDDGEYDDEPLPPPDTVVRQERRIGRNDPCPCGSGKKYKTCCLKKENGAGLFE